MEILTFKKKKDGNTRSSTITEVKDFKLNQFLGK